MSQSLEATAVGGMPRAVATSFCILLRMLALLSSLALGSVAIGSVDELLTSDSPGSLRSQFPKHFIWGAGSSAYQIIRRKRLSVDVAYRLDSEQNGRPEFAFMNACNILANAMVEGGAWEDGKGTSIWDTWAHIPSHTINGATGDVGADEYHHYEEDLDLLVDMNMDSYRFSIAWTRIFPNGTGPDVNPGGVAYYNRLLDALDERGLSSFVTLYHWDLPQTLQDSYGGWLTEQIVADFAAYARVCFALFGDRVKVWSTINEPQQFLRGYGIGGKSPPGITSGPSTDPYIAAHNVLLAHAAAVDVYRREFKADQKGEIGLTLDFEWGEPLTDLAEDIAAAYRHVIFQVGWYVDPLFFGDYPAVMRELVGERLPKFSEEQVLLIKGSMDFLAINYYTARWITSGPGPVNSQEATPVLDEHTISMFIKDGVQIGPDPQSSTAWLFVVPWGLHKAVKWVWERYNTPIYITENGMDTYDFSLIDQLHDPQRIEAFRQYLAALLEALREGIDIRAYYAWSLIDTFEWGVGFDSIFGLVYVDRNDNAKRYPRDSARWFSQVLQRGLSDS